jgi:hypothetical protein
LEQTKQAAAESQQAAGKLGKQPKSPDLAKLQQQVADQTGKVQADKARKPAADAAQALHKGDLKKAIRQQKQALEHLEKRAAENGEADPDKAVPDPASAKNAAELAQAQKGLLAATEALARSQEATQEALAALGQAQAQAPQGVQSELQQAGADLNQAGQQIEQGAAAPAHASQQAAAAQLSKALQAMNAALAAMGQQPSSQHGKSQAMAQASQPVPSRNPRQGKARSPAQERNGAKGSGERVADGQMSNSASELRDVVGAGSFLNLPPRQREIIRQALTGELPAQYAAMIQQYFVNLASGKPAVTEKKK